jgi:hypothetical protein
VKSTLKGTKIPRAIKIIPKNKVTSKEELLLEVELMKIMVIL